MMKSAWIAALLLAVVACDGDDGPGSSSGVDGGAVGGTDARASMAATHWKEDGVLHNAIVAIGTRQSTAQIEFMQVVASDAGSGISFAVSLPGVGGNPPGAIGGDYSCGGTGTAQVIFSSNVEDTNAMQACTMHITSPGVVGGAHASGTFSATITLVGGAKKQITEGVFDVAVQAISG